MSRFADHFSRAPDAYAVYRPTYPAALFAWLAEVAPARERAWDCATGSGQAALALASHFAQVIATDASAAQVSQVPGDVRVQRAVMTAEAAALPAASMSLVTVAQALHWFDRPRFYAEVRRVLAPGGVVAVWRYGLTRIAPAIDAVVDHFYRETVGAYWPAERAIVEAGYGTLEFPFDELAAPAFAMEARWTLAQLAGYLGTWSAVGRYRAATGTDPLPAFVEALAPAWGDAGARQLVRWPLEVRAGRVL